MRQKDREVKGIENIAEIIKSCMVCRLALNDGDSPYIVPMNFGIDIEDGKIILYFHCAFAGKRFDLIKSNNKAGFEVDRPIKMNTDDKVCKFSMDYESVIGKGTIEILTEADKRRGLGILMQHLSDDKEFEFDEKAVNAVMVFKLTVDEVTGKRVIK